MVRFQKGTRIFKNALSMTDMKQKFEHMETMRIREQDLFKEQPIQGGVVTRRFKAPDNVPTQGGDTTKNYYNS